MPTSFELKPRVRAEGHRLYVGFFENSVDQAWVHVPPQWDGDTRMWYDIAECLTIHCGTLGLVPTNRYLARELLQAYEQAKTGNVRAGRPYANYKVVQAEQRDAREEPQGAGSGDGVS
jgi:hypothetical protein